MGAFYYVPSFYLISKRNVKSFVQRRLKLLFLPNLSILGLHLSNVYRDRKRYFKTYSFTVSLDKTLFKRLGNQMSFPNEVKAPLIRFIFAQKKLFPPTLISMLHSLWRMQKYTFNLKSISILHYVLFTLLINT